MVDPVILWTFTIIYVIVVLFLAYKGYQRTKTNVDYLIAGRSVHPAIVGLSYGATFISTSAIIGFGGVAAQLGMGIIWLTVLNISVGILLAFILFGKPTRRIGKKLGALTFPDLLGKAYRSNFMQYSTALIILVGMPLYSSAVLIGGSRYIESVLDISYEWAVLGLTGITAVYVVFGGLRGVMYTDALQGSIMLIGMTAMLILTFVALGGVTSSFEALTDMSSLVPSGLASAGMTGWTSFPELGSNIWYTMVTTIIMGVGIGVLAQPQLAVRFMTAKDGRSLNRAIPIGGVFIIMTTGVAFTVGALTNLYFYREIGQISLNHPDVAGNIDLIMPEFINAAMPEWLVVIFMLTLLAAAMSTMSSLFHVMGSAAGHDIWVHVRKAKFWPESVRGTDEDASKLRVNKIGTGVMILISLGLAFIMPGSIIARATAMFMGLCAAAFLPAYTLALFSKRPSLLAAKASLVVGALSWFIWTAFVHIKESSVLGLANVLTGQDAVLGFPWTVLDPLIVSLPASVIALVVGVYWDRSRSGGREAVEEGEELPQQTTEAD
ncbi:MAG: sodium:solute symporter family protein [Methanomassiliicoccales archaeon]|nr:sodium:solute symporter family protein [Methanomassiliicoccales archaeon]